MANSQKIRATYENLFRKLINTTKGNQKISNFIQDFKNTFQVSKNLPIKLAKARVSLSVSTKPLAKKKAKTTASKARTTQKRKKGD